MQIQGETSVNKLILLFVFDKMETEDNRKPEDILLLMRYIYQNDFWQSKITSPWELRKKYVKIYVQAEKEGWFD